MKSATAILVALIAIVLGQARADILDDYKSCTFSWNCGSEKSCAKLKLSVIL